MIAYMHVEALFLVNKITLTEHFVSLGQMVRWTCFKFKGDAKSFNGS